jgi:6,7-dimethyl-8-ribityllumazine synthase
VTVRSFRRVSSTFSPKEWEGDLHARGLRFAVVCSRWNPTVTEGLLASCLATLAFELPSAARALIQRRRFDALVALGAIVRGETTHNEVLAHAVAGALAHLSADSGVPIGFGLLTCDTMEQARSRTEKGAEAAEAAIEMAALRRALARKG